MVSGIAHKRRVQYVVWSRLVLSFHVAGRIVWAMTCWTATSGACRMLSCCTRCHPRFCGRLLRDVPYGGMSTSYFKKMRRLKACP